jgi:hypothetical protein
MEPKMPDSEVYLRKLRDCGTCGQAIVGVFDRRGTLIAKECVSDMPDHVPQRRLFREYLQRKGWVETDPNTFDSWLDLIVGEEREAGR